MIVNLHVKNFAIIDEIDVDFGEHLNILTGETGAGKSILIGSLGIAMGARVSPEMIGKNGDTATVEAVFQIDDEATLEKLYDLDVEPDEGQIVISRKITASRSINKINGTSVPVTKIKEVAALCITIHGQHDNQTLLHKESHLDIVDDYAGAKALSLRDEIGDTYRRYARLKKEWEEDTLSEAERARQQGFLAYEQQEIIEAALQPDEIESIEESYRRLSHAGAIVESLATVHQLTEETATPAISRALQSMQHILSLDDSLGSYQEELLQIESLMNDFNHEIADYMMDFSFDDNERIALERRLDTIHNLQSKYGDSYDDIMEHLSQVEDKLDKYADYEAYLEEKKSELDACKEDLKSLCARLTDMRRSAAHDLQGLITEALQDLNFAYVDFEISVTERDAIGPNGADEIQFLIATNPGEPRMSLAKIASGGELSRIMLAIRSVFARSDHIDTLVFDEIDSGISGRTAQKVSEKLKILGKHHQVLCITHLAQIAAMADTHFVIEKMVDETRSTTRIRPLDRQQMEEELARLLGGAKITDAVRRNAHEMKELALASVD